MVGCWKSRRKEEDLWRKQLEDTASAKAHELKNGADEVFEAKDVSSKAVCLAAP